MALLTLPVDSYDAIMPYLGVCMTAPLYRLRRGAGLLFAKTYTPELYLLITKAMRLSGHPYVMLPALATTSMTSKTLTVTVEAPIDWTGGLPGPLEVGLRRVLPGPTRVWTKDSAKVVGFVMKKARGTWRELRAALNAIPPQSLRYISMTDGRLPRHMPAAVCDESASLELLHHEGAPTPAVLNYLDGFAKLPRALCFHLEATCFLHWAAAHPELAKDVEALGDVVLCHAGLSRWCPGVKPGIHVKKLGLSVRALACIANLFFVSCNCVEAAVHAI